MKWLDDDRLVVANEGDYKGGSRGFTIFSAKGEVLYESGPALRIRGRQGRPLSGSPQQEGHRAGRSVDAATFKDGKLLFVAAERASLVGVYKDTGAEPEFMQVLPSGIGPEGILAIPSRNLFVTANEVDLGEDGLARSHVMIYELAEGNAAYPMIASGLQDDGTPLGWGALSGLAADPAEAGKLYAVSDSVYRSAPAIFTIDATKTPAMITSKTHRDARRRRRPKARHRRHRDRRRGRLLAGLGRPHRQADAARHPACRRQGQDHRGDRLPRRADGLRDPLRPRRHHRRSARATT